MTSEPASTPSRHPKHMICALLFSCCKYSHICIVTHAVSLPAIWSRSSRDRGWCNVCFPKPNAMFTDNTPHVQAEIERMRSGEKVKRRIRHPSEAHAHPTALPRTRSRICLRHGMLHCNRKRTVRVVSARLERLEVSSCTPFGVSSAGAADGGGDM